MKLKCCLNIAKNIIQLNNADSKLIVNTNWEGRSLSDVILGNTDIDLVLNNTSLL